MARFEDYRDRYPTAPLERQDGVLTVRFHTDGGPLVWAAPSWESFPHLFHDIAADDGNHVVILTGTGAAFIPERAPSPQRRVVDAAFWTGAWRRGTTLLMNLLDIPCPVITALSGPAHIHPELALLSDIVIATPEATIRDSPHLPGGMVPGDGMHVIMPMLMGKLRASYFMLTGQTLSAEECKALGLVNEIVPAAQLMDRARALAAVIRAMPLNNVRATRILLAHQVKAEMHNLLGFGLAMEGVAAIDHFRPGGDPA